MQSVDVVVVSYNSRDRLRGCVEPLAGHPLINVIVVDNNSPDGGLETVADLPIDLVASPVNGGFAYGCNTGLARGTSAYVLLLNPDARIDPSTVQRLVEVLEARRDAGAVAPRIVGEDGSLAHSLRWFPRLRSTYAHALFLHRVMPKASWVDEVIRDPAAYERSWEPEWVSGACVMLRRSSLKRLEGLDEGFFLYCEDTDLGRRLLDAGEVIVYEPTATAMHVGGASSPGGKQLLSVLATSRIRYARKHHSASVTALERLGIAAAAVPRLAVARGGWSRRKAHASALRVAIRPGRKVSDLPNR